MKVLCGGRWHQVGASDELAEAAMDADELELLRLEREADEDEALEERLDGGNGADFEAAAAEEDELAKASAGLKMTFRKIAKSPAASADFVHPDELVQKNGRVHAKNLKAPQANFKVGLSRFVHRPPISVARRSTCHCFRFTFKVQGHR